MDVLDSPSYRINKFLLTFLGLWPFQKNIQKYLIRSVYASIILGIAGAEIVRFVEGFDDLNSIVDSVCVYSTQAAVAIKVLNYIFNAEEIKKLLNRVRHDWTSELYQPQIHIFEKYRSDACRLTEIYSVCMFSTTAFYTVAPWTPLILDFVLPLNESRPIVYPIPVKYGNINPEKYYIPILLHANIIVYMMMTALVAIDTTYNVYVQHACAIYAAVGDRLENVVESTEDRMTDKKEDEQREERIYRSIVACVKMHKDAIDFSDAIESSHTIVFFAVLCLSVLCMSIAGFEVMANLDNPYEALRFGVLASSLVIHIFFLSWRGERLIDHSKRIFEYAYAAKWYQASPRSKKLLLFVMTRSSRPSQLTAGKLYVMSLPNFSLVVKTSVSYFTVLSSFK